MAAISRRLFRIFQEALDELPSYDKGIVTRGLASIRAPRGGEEHWMPEELENLAGKVRLVGGNHYDVEVNWPIFRGQSDAEATLVVAELLAEMYVLMQSAVTAPLLGAVDDKLAQWGFVTGDD